MCKKNKIISFYFLQKKPESLILFMVGIYGFYDFYNYYSSYSSQSKDYTLGCVACVAFVVGGRVNPPRLKKRYTLS